MAGMHTIERVCTAHYGPPIATEMHQCLILDTVDHGVLNIE